MAKVTTRLLKADDPIFREGISRTHPLLEKKRLLALQEASSAESKHPIKKRSATTKT